MLFCAAAYFPLGEARVVPGLPARPNVACAWACTVTNSRHTLEGAGARVAVDLVV